MFLRLRLAFVATTIPLALMLGVAGCDRQEAPAEVEIHTSPAGPRSPVYNLPLNIRIDAPKVPEEIARPAISPDRADKPAPSKSGSFGKAISP